MYFMKTKQKHFAGNNLQKTVVAILCISFFVGNHNIEKFWNYSSKLLISNELTRLFNKL